MASLDEAAAGAEPMHFFRQWFEEARNAEVHEVNAMTLATADAAGMPHARIVLLKGADDTGFTFFTNYDSDKGQQLAANPRAALVFFWPELERQVRVEGSVQKVSREDSDAYFHSRPPGSRLGAWASPQSAVIRDRAELEQREAEIAARYAGADIPRPEHWGGYRLIPQRIEFWQGRASRLHDRICFECDSSNAWNRFRLAP